MKNLKFKTLILSSLVATSTIVPCLISCSKSTIKVKGAGIDTSKSHIEVGKDSTIYLVANRDSKITGIKSITVGTTVLNRMSYNFEYEQVNGLAYKLTIYAKSMTSLDISIEVFNNDLTITDVSYSGNTQPATAALKPLSLEVTAKYKDVEGNMFLTPGEFKVFDDTDESKTDVTKQFISPDGYKMNKAQTYKIIVESVIDSSKSFTKNIDIAEPVHKYYYVAVEHETPIPTECRIKLADFLSANQPANFPPIPDSFPCGGKTKKVTAVTENEYTTTGPCTEQIETLSWECNGRNIKTIETNAFRNLNKLKAFTIPSEVTSIGTNAFVGCNSLATVYIDAAAIATIDNSSQLFTNATTVYIKEGIDDPTSGYISQNYTKQQTSEVAGYNKWTLN